MIILYYYSNRKMCTSSKYLGILMKKIITLCMLFGSLGCLPALPRQLLEYEESKVPFIGDIVFQNEVDPDLCLYFKGNKIQLDINHDKKIKRIGQVLPAQELMKVVPYAFNELKTTQNLHILICSKPEFASDNNTVNYVYVPQNVPYKFYTLLAKRAYDEERKEHVYCWDVRQQQLSVERIIPDNTLIFLFDANFVQGLEIRTWPLNSNVRILPSIIVNQNIGQQDIIRAIVQARMIAIDFDTIHNHHARNATKIESKTVVMVKS